MKFFLTLLVSVFSVSTIAQSGTVEVGGITIRVAGRGAHVCSAQAMSSDRPVLARGESLPEARALALLECQKQGNGFFCEVNECEKDTVNGNLVDVVFDVSRNDANIGINFKGKVKYLCTVEAWNKIYLAKAATKVEAKVLASNECASGNNGSAFFCDVEDSDCTLVSGTTGRIRVGGLLEDIIDN